MPISTPRDENRISTLLATLNSDGVTPVSVTVNPSNHGLKISDGTSGSSIASVNAQRDANRVSAIWGVSSADGITPIPIYCNSNGLLLTKST